jgi:hypothetical protein
VTCVKTKGLVIQKFLLGSTEVALKVFFYESGQA